MTGGYVQISRRGNYHYSTAFLTKERLQAKAPCFSYSAGGGDPVLIREGVVHQATELETNISYKNRLPMDPKRIVLLRLCAAMPSKCLNYAKADGSTMEITSDMFKAVFCSTILDLYTYGGSNTPAFRFPLWFARSCLSADDNTLGVVLNAVEGSGSAGWFMSFVLPQMTDEIVLSDRYVHADLRPMAKSPLGRLFEFAPDLVLPVMIVLECEHTFVA